MSSSGPGRASSKVNAESLQRQGEGIGGRIAGQADSGFQPPQQTAFAPEQGDGQQAHQDEDRRRDHLGGQQFAGGQPWTGSDEYSCFVRQILEILEMHQRRAAHPQQPFRQKAVKGDHGFQEIALEDFELGKQAEVGLIGGDNLVEEVPSTGEECAQFGGNRSSLARR